jgi:hypothetical protein
MTGFMQVMMGNSGGIVVDIDDHTISGTATGSATYFIDAAGTARGIGTGLTNTTYSGEWLLVGSASDYEVRVTIVSGTLTSGTTGSWLSCGSDRNWSITSSVGKTTVLTVEIRNAASLAVLDTATITLQVIV